MILTVLFCFALFLAEYDDCCVLTFICNKYHEQRGIFVGIFLLCSGIFFKLEISTPLFMD